MSKETKNVLVFSILYSSIFALLPFYLFIYFGLFNDIAWYGNYFLFIFPITFIIFLITYRFKFKNRIRYYKKILLLYWVIFIILCIALGLFTRHIMNVVFQNFGF